MSENNEIVVAGLQQISTTGSIKDQENTSSVENEKALQRMSAIGWRIRELVDSPEFKKREKVYNDLPEGTPGNLDGWTQIENHHGRSLTIITSRDENGKAFMLEVHDSPIDPKDSSTADDDGYLRIYFHDDPSDKHRKGEKSRLIWSNTSIHGGAHFDGETSKMISDMSVDAAATRIKLHDFGYPTLGVVIVAGAKNKNGDPIGPIGPINELSVLGIARAIHPQGKHVSDSDFEEIPISPGFTNFKRSFKFDRGRTDFGATKIRDNTGKEILVLTFEGLKKSFSGDRDNPSVEGPERQVLQVPLDLIDGNKVIDLFEEAVDNVIDACRDKPKLNAENI